MNCKALINAAKDKEKVDRILYEEAKTLVDFWTHPDFASKFSEYLAKAITKKSKKPHNGAKL